MPLTSSFPDCPDPADGDNHPFISLINECVNYYVL